jgi:photoactive yellow protein
MSAQEIDELPFGVIKIDRNGTVLQYNATESHFARREVGSVIGRNFFRDIAPCTRHPSFLGRFLEGRDKGEIDVKFEYVFDFKMEPMLVTVQIRKSITDKHFWLLVDWRERIGRELNYDLRKEIDNEAADRLIERLNTPQIVPEDIVVE